MILPRIDASPVVLREFHVGDVPLIMEASADPHIPLIRTVPASPAPEEAQAFITRQHKRLTDGEGFSFAIADSVSDEALGQIGLWPLRDHHAHGRASIGYWVAAPHRGRGVAALALHAISAWGLNLNGVHRLELYVEPWNEPSWRTAERAGYHREGLMRDWQEYDGIRRDMYMYSLLAACSVGVAD